MPVGISLTKSTMQFPCRIHTGAVCARRAEIAAPGERKACRSDPRKRRRSQSGIAIGVVLKTGGFEQPRNPCRAPTREHTPGTRAPASVAAVKSPMRTGPTPWQPGKQICARVCLDTYTRTFRGTRRGQSRNATHAEARTAQWLNESAVCEINAHVNPSPRAPPPAPYFNVGHQTRRRGVRRVAK